MKQILSPAAERGDERSCLAESQFLLQLWPILQPDKIYFGVLRVFNDDTIGPGRGCGGHPHDNMEMITIPLEGALEHKDSLVNVGVITAGKVADHVGRTGVQHSEYNHS